VTSSVMSVDPVSAKKVVAGLRGAPKAFNAELRKESKDIAGRIMTPAYGAAARSYAVGATGAKQAGGVKPRSDRIPKVAIGASRKVYSGGASTIMVRHRSGAARWLPIARGRYMPAAMRAWLVAVDGLCREWNAGGAD
jgi:hypothetical protein